MRKLKIRIKPILVYGKWTLIRFPFSMLYRLALLFKLPLEKQVNWLPPPLNPPVYWTDIDRVTLHGSLEYPPFGRWCKNGNWDIERVYPLPSVFKEIPKGSKKWEVHETIRSMFISKKEFRKTPQYKIMVDEVNKGAKNPPQGCNSVQEVDNYFKKLKKAFKSMKKKGYKTQVQLGKTPVEEIRLHITREGKLCLGTGGNHRIRMAELLGIKTIPFLLKGIHPEWVKKLSKDMNLPPHQAISNWLDSNFESININSSN